MGRGSLGVLVVKEPAARPAGRACHHAVCGGRHGKARSTADTVEHARNRVAGDVVDQRLVVGTEVLQIDAFLDEGVMACGDSIAVQIEGDGRAALRI